MRLGLRAKSALALGLCIAIVILLALFAGGRALRGIEENLGTAFARNATQYNKQRILTPVLRELALSQRLADSEVTRRWLLDEKNPQKKSLFFAEAEGYRHAFEDKSYFLISATSLDYYFNDKKSKWSDKPRYVLKRGNVNDDWFFATLKNTHEFNINVDLDVKLKLTKIWFNVLVKDGERKIGLAGTGLDLTEFLRKFITNDQAGVTPMILNGAGSIQAHPDPKLIDFASINDKGAKHSTIYRLLPRPEDQAAMRSALSNATKNSAQIQTFWAEMNGDRELFAVSAIPELNWFAVTAVDLKAARVLDSRLWLLPLLTGGALLIVLMLAVLVAVNRIVLTPLLRLTNSVRAVGAGDYDVSLPPAGNDEIGELTRAFDTMATQVRSHTEELETKIHERTRELVAVNEQVVQANQQIGDSIQYASLIQNAILPDRELARAMSGEYFVLWRPRDVVGGDIYVFRADDNGCLIGVVDCAGHGVPGALMTMIAHSAVNVAVDSLGMHDPAALLVQVDARIRAMLHTDPNYSQVATHMDAGLAYVDFGEQSVTFSGAKVSLYWCDGEDVGEIKGDRVAIGGKRVPEFTNTSTPLDGSKTFYMTTDGLLDQAGGPKGFSFGNARFASLMQRHAGRPLSQQREGFADELAAYQGELAQRDDITVLSFRFARQEENNGSR